MCCWVFSKVYQNNVKKLGQARFFRAVAFEGCRLASHLRWRWALLVPAPDSSPWAGIQCGNGKMIAQEANSVLNVQREE